jgi:hypothetical protein
MNMRPFGMRFGAMLLALSVIAAAPAPKIEMFATPDAGVSALVAALQADDHDKLKAMFGAKGFASLVSGDPVADSSERDEFLAAYQTKHDVKVEGDTATLVVGADDWPMPIPLIKSATGWSFDVAAGVEEVLDRRVGANELFTQEALLAYSDAQQEYSHSFHDGLKIHVYAQKFLSSPGKQDGLYWPTEDAQPLSPLGEPVAEASYAGYSGKSGSAQPFHGYYYKILTAQGPHAPGGAYDYKAKNLMLGGYAAVAWPANWGHTGVMTFLINQDGEIYQKNLGSKSAELGKAMTGFDPDASWTKLGVPAPSPGALPEGE